MSGAKRAVFLDLNGTVVLPLKQQSLRELARSYVIGDSAQDVQAAERFGGTGCLVRTGWPITDEGRVSATDIHDSIVESVDWILQWESGQESCT